MNARKNAISRLLAKFFLDYFIGSFELILWTFLWALRVLHSYMKKNRWTERTHGWFRIKCNALCFSMSFINKKSHKTHQIPCGSLVRLAFQTIRHIQCSLPNSIANKLGKSTQPQNYYFLQGTVEKNYFSISPSICVRVLWFPLIYIFRLVSNGERCS